MNDHEHAMTEIVPETTAAAQPANAAADAAGIDLQAALEQARADVDRYRDEMLRARAELENVRKRAQKDVEAAHKYGLERLVEALLPLKDSLDLGFDAAQSAQDVASIRDGLALTVKMAAQAFEKIGVKALDPAGEKFNPDFHQAMGMEDSLEAEPGTVLRVMQKGYVLNERLVRPALVVIAKQPTAC